MSTVWSIVLQIKVMILTHRQGFVWVEEIETKISGEEVAILRVDKVFICGGGGGGS